MADLTDGFLFGLHILDSLGVDFDSKDVQRCVREVAEGFRFLRNSQEDEMQNMEHNRDVPFDEPERGEVLGHLRDWRKDIDAKNTAIAKQIISEMPR